MGEAVAYQSFPVIAGEQVSLPITCTDNNGDAVTLTGGTPVFRMARDEYSEPALDSSESPATAAIAIDSPPTSLTVTLTDEQTASLSGDYYYEVEFEDAAGAKAVVARGWITVQRKLSSA